MRQKIPILCLTVLGSFSSHVASEDFSAAGAPFLMIYSGARQVGMAGAFCAIADDAMATYYNSAGIAFQTAVDVNVEYARWLKSLYPDMFWLSGYGVIPLGRRWALAPAVTYLTTGEAEGTDPYGTRIARWRTWNLVAGMYCGVRVSDYFGVGVGVKYIHSYFAPDWLVAQLFNRRGGGAGKSLAVDTGILGRFPLPLHLGRIGLGMTLQNIGPSISYIEGGASDPLPSALRMGISYTLTLRDVVEALGRSSESPASDSDWLRAWFLDESRICVALDRCAPTSDMFGDSWRSLGFELAPFPVFAFRFGHFEDTMGHRSGWTWGWGVDFKFVRFDLASDSNIYEFRTSNQRYTWALNIGTPVLSR